MDKIKHIKKVLTNLIAILNNKDIIYGISVKTINNTSYDKIVFSLNTKK